MMRNHLIMGVALILAATAARAEEVYRWVDEDGKVHYGDMVPPQHVDKQREIINEYGVKVGVLPSKEQLAEYRRQKELEERLKRERAMRAVQDRILLDTYLSVDEIESLRDRRLATLEQHAMLTENHLATLRARVADLEQEAHMYNYPYSAQSEKPPVPQELATELMDTVGAIEQYDADLEKRRQAQAKWRMKFEADIDRFRELKKLN